MYQTDYPDRDYHFGQMILRLRSAIGLTQTALAEHLGISRRSIIKWEDGTNYPKDSHLKELIALAHKQRCFQVGHEVEEIRALWHASRQKNLLDEIWLAKLLNPASLQTLPPLTNESSFSELAPISALPQQKNNNNPRFDWGDAQAVPTFYGREGELRQLAGWVTEERCRVVSILGMGGLGKSSLAVTLMHQLSSEFEVVIWRSLRDADKCENLLDEYFQVLAPQLLDKTSLSLKARISQLLEQLRSRRVLLVLDNLESLLLERENAGHMQPGYEGYSQLFRQIAQTNHQSCLVLTSREKSADLIPFEGTKSSVKVLYLTQLSADACEQLLADKAVKGATPEKTRLIEAYTGNPLALKIVAQTIVEVFDGEIAPFLEQGEIIFGEVQGLLDQQFNRLSKFEQNIMMWLAIMREPVTFEELVAVWVTPVSRGRLLEAVEALRRRSLIERGQKAGSFTLQSVVLEYITLRLITEAATEIQQGKLVRLIEHNLVQAQAKDYIRQSQERLLITPLLDELQTHWAIGKTFLLDRFNALFAELRTLNEAAQGYGPTNLVSLIHVQKGDLCDLDLSRLVLRDVYLQGVQMQHTNLSEAIMRDSIFSETFGSIGAMAISGNGEYLVATNMTGGVILWKAATLSMYRVWQNYTKNKNAMARFSLNSDGRTIVTGVQMDGIKLWELENGTLLTTFYSYIKQHIVYEVVFSPDSRKIAGVITNEIVRIWDVQTGRELQNLLHSDEIPVLMWSPDGRKLACGDVKGIIQLWEIPQTGEESAICVQTLTGHTKEVVGLAFAPDGQTLASASWDGTVKLWDVHTGQLRHTLTGHKDRVSRLAWSPDGRWLASGGRDSDPSIWLWDVAQAQYQTVLLGHRGVIRGLGFTPDSSKLLSGSGEGAVRLWEVASGQCLKIAESYSFNPITLSWSPDGTQLVSSSSNALIIIHDLTGKQPNRWLHGNFSFFANVHWSPDGRWIAASEKNNTIRLWDAETGEVIYLFELGASDGSGYATYALEWSSDGRWLATATSNAGVVVWDVLARRQRWPVKLFPVEIISIEWHPDGTRLGGTGNDGNLYIWDAIDGTLLQQINAGADNFLFSPAWSPDGKYLAVTQRRNQNGSSILIWDTQSWERVPVTFSDSESGVSFLVIWDQAGKTLLTTSATGTVFCWEVESGKCLRMWEAHKQGLNSLGQSPDGSRLASSANDGNIKIWDSKSGELLQTIRYAQPYEGLNITGIRGLSEGQQANLRTLGAVDHDFQENEI